MARQQFVFMFYIYVIFITCPIIASIKMFQNILLISVKNITIFDHINWANHLNRRINIYNNIITDYKRLQSNKFIRYTKNNSPTRSDSNFHPEEDWSNWIVQAKDNIWISGTSHPCIKKTSPGGLLSTRINYVETKNRERLYKDKTNMLRFWLAKHIYGYN